MNIKLVKLTPDYKDLLFEMLAEWKADIEENGGNHSPYAIFRNDYRDFDNYLANLECKEETKDRVPDSVFFCLDMDKNKFVGAVNIRHYFNDDIYLTGGHIGDGIRPSERRKGYATAMIGLALEECKKLGINKVLMVCDKDNIGSAKSIMANGGVFESEVDAGDGPEHRYWINLHEETVETDRMELRRIMPYDYMDMYSWMNDDRVTKYLLSATVTDPKNVLERLQTNDPSSRTKYLMLLKAKNDGHAIGIVGVCKHPDSEEWEISYSVRFDDWNMGYTTEACKAMMEYVAEMEGAKIFIGECAEENIASRKVLEKLGMKFMKNSSYTTHEGITYKSLVYSSL